MNFGFLDERNKSKYEVFFGRGMRRGSMAIAILDGVKKREKTGFDLYL